MEVEVNRLGMQTGPERLLLRVDEAAELASISRALAYRLVATGTWPSVTIGRSRRVPLEGLRAWVHRLPPVELPLAETIETR